MKNLPLPDHFEVGDLVKTTGITWLHHYVNELAFVTKVDWGLERLRLFGINRPFDNGTFYLFKDVELVRKNNNKLIKLVFT
jgi:hypothetical protein